MLELHLYSSSPRSSRTPAVPSRAARCPRRTLHSAQGGALASSSALVGTTPPRGPAVTDPNRGPRRGPLPPSPRQRHCVRDQRGSRRGGEERGGVKSARPGYAQVSGSATFSRPLTATSLANRSSTGHSKVTLRPSQNCFTATELKGKKGKLSIMTSPEPRKGRKSRRQPEGRTKPVEDDCAQHSS